MFFFILLIFLCVQRLLELSVAKKNEKWLLQKGAIICGQEHYPFMIVLHISFLISLIIEVVIAQQGLSSYWLLLTSVFLFLQIARYWVISTLGKYWNTKIIVLPGTQLVQKGLYQYMKHPNYIIVTLELLIVPLIFRAYVTAILFFFLNQWILRIRIHEEEKALQLYAKRT